MNLSTNSRSLLRDLAKQVAEIAARPEIARRKTQWVEHNSLRSAYPMMLVFPEGAWAELLPDDSLQCDSVEARPIELALRQRIYTFNHFQDDSVIEAEWVVGAPLYNTGWGLEPVKFLSSEERGAFRIEPVLQERSDLKKMHFPDLVYDEAAHSRELEEMHALFGDILQVKRKGIAHISYHLWSQYLYLRGEHRYMEDLLDAPDFIHEVLSFFEQGHHRLLSQMIDLNLLSLNNDNTYHSSGGNGYTEQLPAPGFNPDRVRPCDLWASAESQELAGVSPRMHRDFALQYESRLLAPFGLTGYGCCEDLAGKIEDVLQIPNMRRISISPFASVARSAENLQGRAIYSWKPQPAHLVGEFQTDAIREYIRHTLQTCQAHGCFLEMILKDTHTCEHHPERFDEWTRIAREEILASAGGQAQ
jgi:hypothetical protein